MDSSHESGRLENATEKINGKGIRSKSHLEFQAFSAASNEGRRQLRSDKRVSGIDNTFTS